METAIDLYRFECSSDPVSIHDLISASDNVAGNCKYSILQNIPIDPWGTTYRLLTTSSGLYVSSAGPDSTWKSGDDIVGAEVMRISHSFKCEDPLKMTAQDYLKYFAFYGMLISAFCSILYFRKRLYRLFVK